MLIVSKFKLINSIFNKYLQCINIHDDWNEVHASSDKQYEMLTASLNKFEINKEIHK
jgi:hypothetical protein